MSHILSEITPLSDRDCFYLVDRNKTEFDYPLHRHDEIELNFVSNCTGARRIVGDSIEELGEYDLALIGSGIEHCWDQHYCDKTDKREITIQFRPDLLPPEFLAKNQMRSIAELLRKAQTGVAFGMRTIMGVYSRLDSLANSLKSDFSSIIGFLDLLYQLSLSTDSHQLATTSFSRGSMSTESRRVNRVEEEINKRYDQELTLDHLARIAGMTPTAFSRFFKQRTGRTLSEYIIDIRLGHASRQLVDTSMAVSEICYQCGFTNITSFNRIFKAKKGCTPKTFRENYLKTRIIV
ncbi:MAG: helix-turn-helix transcriptional regulator [Bacteroidaceae bacterium]|nr:helix-turn-helix transcriptional regulator [Bacteroidaceae bacterium]